MNSVIIIYLLNIIRKERQDMNIRQIQSFIAVADTKSFSEAARLMYTSVSQISKLVKSFEEELGQVFFERKKNGVALTLEGMKIYNVANKILKDIDDLEFMKERKGKESFTILGLPDVSIDSIFTDYLKVRSGREQFYNLSYKPIDSVSQELHVRKADIGFAYADKIRYTAIQMRLKDYALEFIPLATAQKYIFLCKDHPLAKNKHISLKQTEALGQIKINGTDFLNSEIKKNNVVEIGPGPVIKMITHNLSTALKVVSRTDMVYVGCDIFDVAGEYENIRRIPFEGDSEGSQFGFIKRNNLELSETAGEFLEYIKKHLS